MNGPRRLAFGVLTGWMRALHTIHWSLARSEFMHMLPLHPFVDCRAYMRKEGQEVAARWAPLLVTVGYARFHVMRLTLSFRLCPGSVVL